MALCASCGAENPEGFRFCGACGAETSSQRVELATGSGTSELPCLPASLPEHYVRRPW